MLIDLSVTINENTPVYPGDPKTTFKPAGVIDSDGYADTYVSIGTHVGTHIDAPMHMIKGGKSLDQIPIDHFIGTGKLITVDKDFNSVKNVSIQEGDIVLLSTGMSAKYNDQVYFEDYPVMTEDIANYLVQTKVKIVGVDTCSVDNKDGFPIHKILLAGDVLIIENLTNLEQLVGKDFKVYALPPKFQLDGFTSRVVAEIS